MRVAVINKIKSLNYSSVGIIIFAIAASLLFILGQASITGATAKITPSWAVNNKLVAHAMGAVDGVAYTNSLEAFKESYNKGYRVFEVDFIFTSDNKLVAKHEWESNCTNRIMSYSEYMNTKICGKYTSLSVDDVMQLMNRYPDIYIITDTKDIDEKTVKAAFSAMYNSAKKLDAMLLNRITPQVYSQDMYDWVESVYDFKDEIYTLYKSNDSNEQVLDFVAKNDISMVAMPLWRCNEEFIEKLNKFNVIVYAHTVNTESEKSQYENLGVYGFYSDALKP